MTDKPKHTPGPWVPHFNDDGEYSGEIHVWGDCDYDGCVADWVAEANAHLIAAAPEMYEALGSVVAAFELSGEVGKHEVGEALRAIAKAEGKQ